MTGEQEYFIYLLLCFLNERIPAGNENTDWNKVFYLADINDVGGIIASEIKRLPAEFTPTGKVKSDFNQLLGYCLINYENKIKTLDLIKSFLSENSVDFILVKWAVLNVLYPEKELRTSGDIDFIVREDEFENVYKLLKSSSEKLAYDCLEKNPVAVTFKLNNICIEIHRDADVFTDYFKDFFSLCTKQSGCCYSLDSYNHLLYLICHFAKHIKEGKAGIRMILDLDVLIRSIDEFDEEYFYSLCEKAEIRKTAEMLLSLINCCFNTPVNDVADIKNNKKIYELFVTSLINGGSFNHLNSSFSQIHINNLTSGTNPKSIKHKAILRYLFPPPEYVRPYYNYSIKHRWLVPLAYLNRAFDAAFKRGSKSLKTVNEIANLNEGNLASKQLIDALYLTDKGDNK